ncbi:MAG: hypothetical protein L0220_19755, partial [Acidobacteria bacterium]|nr:hypothetical protein [Acidobacteriota bacterium]
MMKFAMANYALLLLLLYAFASALAQNSNQPAPIPLWAEGAPGAKGSQPEDIPSIQLYQPSPDRA